MIQGLRVDVIEGAAVSARTGSTQRGLPENARADETEGMELLEEADRWDLVAAIAVDVAAACLV